MDAMTRAMASGRDAVQRLEERVEAVSAFEESVAELLSEMGVLESGEGDEARSAAWARARGALEAVAEVAREMVADMEKEMHEAEGAAGMVGETDDNR